MADKSKATEGGEDSSSRMTSENELKQPKQLDLTLGNTPLERGERTTGSGSGSSGQAQAPRRFSAPVTQAKRDATARERDDVEPPERIPSILHSMPLRRESGPDRPYPPSRESVSPIGYPPDPLP